MKKIILYTCEADGIGDLEHLFGIYEALKKTNGALEYDFIPVVHSDISKGENYLKKLAHKLKLLNRDNFFLITSREKDLAPELKAHIKSAEQVIFISNDCHKERLIECLDQDKVITKHILEHEQHNWVQCGSHTLGERECHVDMGLAADCYGIKIEDIQPESTEMALSKIQVLDPNFSSVLLNVTKTNNFKELNNRNLIIPAYYANNAEGSYALSGLLYLLGINTSLPKNKDILVYLSTGNTELLPRLLKEVIDNKDSGFFKNSNYNQVEIYQKDKEPLVIRGNPDGDKILKLLAHYWIDTAVYNQLYHCAYMVGASGDNTFEKAVSYRCLPHYISSSYWRKRDTLASLINIIYEANLPISDKIKNDLGLFFEAVYTKDRYAVTYEPNLKDFEKYRTVNIPEMTLAWKHVAAYLKSNFNYYNKIEIILNAKSNRECITQKNHILHSKIYKKTLKSSPSLLSSPKELREPHSKTQIFFSVTTYGMFNLINHYVRKNKAQQQKYLSSSARHVG